MLNFVHLKLVYFLRIAQLLNQLHNHQLWLNHSLLEMLSNLGLDCLIYLAMEINEIDDIPENYIFQLYLIRTATSRELLRRRHLQLTASSRSTIFLASSGTEINNLLALGGGPLRCEKGGPSSSYSISRIIIKART